MTKFPGPKRTRQRDDTRALAVPTFAQTGNIGPLSTILSSVLLLGEPFTIWIALGTALVLAGVYLLARWR